MNNESTAQAGDYARHLTAIAESRQMKLDRYDHPQPIAPYDPKAMHNLLVEITLTATIYATKE